MKVKNNDKQNNIHIVIHNNSKDKTKSKRKRKVKTHTTKSDIHKGIPSHQQQLKPYYYQHQNIPVIQIQQQQPQRDLNSFAENYLTDNDKNTHPLHRNAISNTINPHNHYQHPRLGNGHNEAVRDDETESNYGRGHNKVIELFENKRNESDDNNGNIFQDRNITHNEEQKDDFEEKKDDFEEKKDDEAIISNEKEQLTNELIDKLLASLPSNSKALLTTQQVKDLNFILKLNDKKSRKGKLTVGNVHNYLDTNKNLPVSKGEIIPNTATDSPMKNFIGKIFH